MTEYVLFGDSINEVCFALLHAVDRQLARPLTHLPKAYSQQQNEPAAAAAPCAAPVAAAAATKEGETESTSAPVAATPTPAKIEVLSSFAKPVQQVLNCQYSEFCLQHIVPQLKPILAKVATTATTTTPIKQQQQQFAELKSLFSLLLCVLKCFKEAKDLQQATDAFQQALSTIAATPAAAASTTAKSGTSSATLGQQFALQQYVALFNLLREAQVAAAQQPHKTAVRTALLAAQQQRPVAAKLDTQYVCALLQSSIQFALTTGQADQLKSQTLLASLLAMADEWSTVSQLTSVELYRLVYELACAQSNAHAHTVFLHRYLVQASRLTVGSNGAFAVTQPQYDALVLKARPAARQAALLAIQQPLSVDSESSSLLTPQRVLTLRIVATSLFHSSTAAAEDKTLFKALLLFTSQDALIDLAAFLKSNAKFLAAQHIDESVLRGKLRTLALCQLGSQNTKLSYAEIARKLQIESASNKEQLDSVNAVEEAIIDAVGSGLIECKMAQAEQKLHVKRVTQTLVQVDSTGERVTVDWQSMREKLATWQKELYQVAQTLQQQTQQNEDY